MFPSPGLINCYQERAATLLPGLVAVTPGENEGMVFVSNADEMAEKLVTVLKDGKYRRRLGQSGLKYVLKRHSCESIAAQLEARLQEAIERKGSEKRK